MTTLEDIEKAVAQLPAEKLTEFRAWFEEFDAALFDARIEMDTRSGRLEKLADETRRALKEGGVKEV